MQVILWVAVIALTATGGVLYLVFETSAWWWMGSLASLPLWYLVITRQERLEKESGGRGSAYGGFDDGTPFGPP